MLRPRKVKTDFFATMEDDIKQFLGALAGVFRAAPGAIAKRMATPTRRAFAHRIDLWDSTGEKMVEHLAGVEDFELAMRTFRAACERWPGANITLQARAKVLEDSRRAQTDISKYPLA
jgi:hypothetical protein